MPQIEQIRSPNYTVGRVSYTGGITYRAIAIVNHIMAGTMNGTIQWFLNSSVDYKRVSAHYCIGRDGRIVQMVDLADTAWANGRIQEPDPRISWLRGVPWYDGNYLTISKEHEGADGSLAEPQLQASLWLDYHIRDEVARRGLGGITLDPLHVIGHCQIDSVGKPDCPGALFPWQRIYEYYAPPRKPKEYTVSNVSDDVIWLGPSVEEPRIPGWCEYTSYVNTALNAETWLVVNNSSPTKQCHVRVFLGEKENSPISYTEHDAKSDKDVKMTGVPLANLWPHDTMYYKFGDYRGMVAVVTERPCRVEKSLKRVLDVKVA